MAHDFFTSQPIQRATIYLLLANHPFITGPMRTLCSSLRRYYLHCASVRVLLSTSTSRPIGHDCMEREAAIVSGSYTKILSDAIESEDHIPNRACSNMDMIQAIGFNSIERTASDWKRLFQSLDHRLQFLGTRTSPGSSMSLTEAQFQEDRGSHVPGESYSSSGTGTAS